MDLALTPKKDYSISLARFLATAFIITCHVMQYNNFVLAWWFNVGVQMFLCMSGFLYGQKEITSTSKFYKKQLLKILVDYYIIIFTVSAIQFIFMPESISIFKFAKSLLAFGTLSGGEHLWYISYIILCYILTPMLSGLVRFLHEGENTVRLIVGSILILSVSLAIFSTFFSYFNSAWINCYIIGFILGYCKTKSRAVFNKLFTLITAVCIAMNLVQIYLSYVAKMQFSGIWEKIYQIFCDYAHVALGCFLFLAIHLVFSKLFSQGIPSFAEQFFDASDRVSYDVYLVHQFLILGPLSLMAITAYQWLNVVVIIVSVLGLALLLNYLSGLVRRLINALISKLCPNG